MKKICSDDPASGYARRKSPGSLAEALIAVESCRQGSLPDATQHRFRITARKPLQNAVISRPRRQSSFRAHPSAASLKHGKQLRRHPVVATFRAHPSAASLKRSIWVSGRWTTYAFRAHPRGASLKQHTVFRIQSSSRPFRAHPSAASLKQIIHGCPPRRSWPFRAHPSAASLKHRTQIACSAFRINLSALTRARLR